MTKWILGFTLLFSVSSFASHVPPTSISGLEPEFNLRIFYQLRPFNFLSEIKSRFEIDNRKYRSIRLGGYYRFHSNFKLGLFYIGQWGMRHDEDWVDTNQEWFWRNTNGRFESVLNLGLTSRVDFGANWIGELKSRYFYNFFNSQSTLKFRPGVTYFWMKGDQPFLSFFHQLEFYIPINYSALTLYEIWAYLGVLYSLNETLQLGSSFAYRATTWSEYTGVNFTGGEAGDTYRETATAYVLSLNVILRFDFTK